MKKRATTILSSLLSALVLISAAQAAPWDDSQRLKKISESYDKKAVVTLSGTIQRIYEIKPHNSPSYGFHMILKTPEETVNVHLGPGWYLKKMDDYLLVGDEVQVTGAMTKDLVAEGNTKIRSMRGAEVKKGTITLLKLREKNGQPVWRGF